MPSLRGNRPPPWPNDKETGVIRDLASACFVIGAVGIGTVAVLLMRAARVLAAAAEEVGR